MKRVIKLMATVLSVALVSTALTACGSSQKAAPSNTAAATAKAEGKYTFKYSVTFPPTGTQAEGAAILKKLIEEYSGGKIEVKLYPSSQLGDKIPTMQGLQIGTIEMTELAASDLSNYNKMWSAFSLPYTFNNGEDAIKVVNDPAVAKILSEDAEKLGFKIISWMNVGERNILNSKRPVQKPEDLKGLKIRVMQDPILAKAIGAMGATGTPMAFNEVYGAIQQKVVDGLENSVPVISANKFQEVAKYYSRTEHFVIPDPVLVSKKVFDSLPADLQQAVMKAGKDFQAQFISLWAKSGEKEMETLKAAGVKVSEVDKEAFKAAVKPMVEDYLKSADDKSKALYDAFVAAGKK